MIRTNGFYLKPANEYTDSITGAEVKGFIHWAYMFLDNRVVKRCRKETSDNVVSYNKTDFSDAYSGEYCINGNVLNIVFDKGARWEYKESFTLKSDSEFVDENQTFVFHEWGN